MLFLQKFVKVNRPLCHDCGRSLVVKFTTRTLVQGWWGYISFFVNWFVLVANVVAWVQFSRLPRPTLSGNPVPESAYSALG
jgi:hypothetical protein